MLTKEKLLEGLKKYAEKNGYMLNPDKKIRETIVEGLLRNKQKYGRLYCPCRRVTGDKDKDKDIICPCKFHKEEIERFGMCHCMLFVKKK